ncbi:ATP-binding cassette domain-containing protein [Oceanobacillus halophilus]|uniref:ATP-binding cassette domain-containing protein n=1 Tax=Oceanobacillus halophilus TaxID=930130 RepID=A0A495A3E4_9BACI|nr:ATP-binding cassette domain-containing protein [Oceanobacillus halophilus]RKQ33478.1 ATP-binding cassette domain-containing protein [Oceanobacillus halophilus]
MIILIQKNSYKAFGFNIESEFTLPELFSDKSFSYDIKIKRGNLTNRWFELSKPKQYFYVTNNLCMFEVPEVAIFKIENGNTITVSPYENAHEDQIRLYLLGTCMGAILLQRNILPLHGSAIVIDGKAYAIVGDSGAGKSTLASAFLRRGYQLLSDDVIAISLDKENQPIVTPSYPQQKLWQKSLDHFGMESTHFRPVIQRETKFAVPVKNQFITKPMPLAGIIELTKKESGLPEIRSIQVLERLYTLYAHTYRNFLIGRSGLMEWHFETTAKMANKIDFYQIKRPEDQFTANELVNLILNNVQKGERVI